MLKELVRKMVPPLAHPERIPSAVIFCRSLKLSKKKSLHCATLNSIINISVLISTCNILPILLNGVCQPTESDATTVGVEHAGKTSQTLL